MKEISFDDWYQLINRVNELENETQTGVVFGVIGFVLSSVVFAIIVYHAIKD